MKHSWKITAILLSMFLITQFIGLYVINSYKLSTNDNNQTINPLPKAFQTPTPQSEKDFWFYFIQIIPAFIIAIILVMLLTKYKVKIIIRLWFLFVIFIALALAFNAFLMPFTNPAKTIAGFSSFAILIAIPLALLKVFRPSIILHNFTELLIYPGIAAVFVPILNIPTMILLLIIISIYDMWAVWHSGIMQKMAKFQMEELKIFGGFFVPYISKKLREKINRIKNSKTKSGEHRKIKVSLAILGGGDVVFPIITAGVVMLRLNSIIPALFVIFGALAGLTYLLMISEKKKFYPAMPFITSGIFLGLILYWLIFKIII